MNERFETPLPQSSERKEEDYYDPETDPLKPTVDTVIATHRNLRAERVFNKETKMFERPKKEQILDGEDLTNLPWPNKTGHPQDGLYMVNAFSIDRLGKFTGGGWVATFNKRYDAERCAYILRKMDQRYEPRIGLNEDHEELKASGKI